MPRRFSLDGRSSASAGAEASSSKEAKINEELWEQLYALRKRSNKTYEVSWQFWYPRAWLDAFVCVCADTQMTSHRWIG